MAASNLQLEEWHLPVFYQILTMMLVLVSLLMVRQFEKPRRRVAVWVFDLTRLAIGYASAEILLLLFVVSYPGQASSIQKATAGSEDPFYRRWANAALPGLPQQMQGASPTSSASPAGTKQGLPASLVLSALELFPGVFLIYGLYMVVLYASYRAKVAWDQKVTGFRIVRNNHTGDWTFQQGAAARDHYPTMTTVGMSEDKFFTKGDKQLQMQMGFVSGNYGTPVKLQWFGQQTAALVLAVFLVRMAIIKLCTRYSQGIILLSSALFGWAAYIPSHALQEIVVFVVVPSIVYSAHFCLADYLLRYKATVGKFGYKAVDPPLPLYEPSRLATDDDTSVDRAPVSSSVSPSLYEDYPTSYSRSFGTARSVSGNQLNSRGPRRTPTPADPSPVSVATSEASPHQDNIEEDIEAMVEDLRDFGKQALDTVVKRFDSPSTTLNSAVNVGLQYGIVTASLLNSAAMNATASARPLFFGASRGNLGGAGLNQRQFLPTQAQPRMSRPASGGLGLEGLDTDDSASEASDDVEELD